MRDGTEAQLDDVTLIRRIAAGNRAAFEALVKRYWASMYRYAAAAAHDGAAAEDAVQETFTAVWRSAAGFRGEVTGRAWLFTIARNALDHRLRRRAGEPQEMASLDDVGAAAGWGTPSTSDQVMAAIETRERVHKAMAALSPEDREVLVLMDVEELTAEEAGPMLGLSVSALKSRLHRARLRLIAQLGKEDFGEG